MIISHNSISIFVKKIKKLSQANFEAENIIWKNEWIKIWNWKPYEKTHQTVHEGCKNVKCESCGKSFTQADFLSRHMKIIH